ncbi:flagellar hook-associated protein FlgK [Oceanobacillus halotolerans]|uniref:flagellar hook-associated protein FlgK n=1 Tax=Oceanobacillus halotolerans TaxID=2663380 RepID=UPI0013DB84C7|nr:flagellar hook-associated protein FlgK [Oceanobacillus halotolerans]
MSTFHGLEMAKQALFAQQSALHTTGHNISNANTDGYTRQRVNFETTSPFPSASRNRPNIPGQMGTGVEAGTVQRVRDQFLDTQFRSENSKSGYYEAMADATDRMESLLNEPSDSGLSTSMDQFWQSLQDLSVNPENSGARSVVVQRGLALAEAFNYTADSLESIRSDLKNEIEVTTKNANSILEQISGINDQIKQIEPHGYLANDLYDERDRLIDELSGMMNIDVSYSKSGDSAPDVADGLVTIKLADEKGVPIEDAPALLKAGAGKGDYQELEVHYLDEGDQYGAVAGITIGEYESKEGEKMPTGEHLRSIEDFLSNGSLKGNIDAFGYVTTTDGSSEGMVSGLYTDMLSDIDTMVEAFATKFNEVHKEGEGLNGEPEGFDGNFFVSVDGENESITATSITVHSKIQENPDLIAASKEDGGSGNGDNASELAAVFDESLDLDEDASVRTYYESLIGDLGVAAQEANRMSDNTEVLRSQVEQQRQSVSSVSLDEEMSNMIKFQHAYNAAARSMTVMDELLDRIINNMGLVGR